MARQRSLRAKDKRHRLATNSAIGEQVAPESRIDSPVKSKPYLTIALFLFLGSMAYAAWFTDAFVFTKDKAVLEKGAPSSAKNRKKESRTDFDLPPQNQQIDRGYNASSGKFPPGALPAGVNLPGVSSYNPSMQPRAMVSEYGVDDGVRQKFTGQIRDSETNLDYFNARYYNSSHGRFTSVDPGSAGAKLDDPQSWNAYAYARNNPLMYTDPDGREYVICEPGGGNCRTYTDAQAVKFKNDTGVGTFVGSYNEKTGLYSGNIVGPEGQIYGTVQQTSIDSVGRRLGLGGAPTLDIWQKPIEILGMGVLGLFGGPVRAGAAPIVGALAGTATRGVGTAAASTAGVSVAAQTATTLASQLRFTGTTALRQADAARRVPLHTLADVILTGRRMADPQGAPGAIKIVSEMYKNGKRYNIEVVYREADKTILHFLYKSK